MVQKRYFSLLLRLIGRAILFVVFCSITALHAQENITTNDKIFSKQQAKIGATLYKNNCLICHDKKYFRPVFKAWDGQSLGTFYLVMSSSMPESNPGSLSQQEYVDILAYILSLNRYSSGEDVLLPSTEILNKITISARKK